MPNIRPGIGLRAMAAIDTILLAFICVHRRLNSFFGCPGAEIQPPTSADSGHSLNGMGIA
jgi:hypothetical protein